MSRSVEMNTRLHLGVQVAEIGWHVGDGKRLSKNVSAHRPLPKQAEVWRVYGGWFQDSLNLLPSSSIIVIVPGGYVLGA
jgi:hypothetical protein